VDALTRRIPDGGYDEAAYVRATPRMNKVAAEMLVSFTTRFGHLLMQGEPALSLLRLGGHSGAVPGAILEADLPAFLMRLQAGLEAHGDEFSPAPEETADPQDRDDDAPRERPVRLRLRAVPLLELIEIAVRQHSDLMWERA
jgi:hypothetical protein